MTRPEAGLQFRAILDSIGVSRAFGRPRVELGRITLRRIACAARYDASYLSLMIRGRVPPQEGARRTAGALLTFGARREDVDLWLWLCGYAPDGLSTHLREQVSRAAALPVYEQRKVASGMRHELDALLAETTPVKATPPPPAPPRPPHPRRAVTTLAQRLREALG